MNIEQLLQNNRFAVAELLRQNHITYTDIREGIRKGYEMQGDSFAIKLVNIISKDVSGWDPATDTGPPPPDGSVETENGTIVPDSGSGSRNFWDTWGNVLNYVGKTGSTYQQFMQNLSGTATNGPRSTYTTQGSNLTWLYIGGGILLLIIVLILIFK